MDTLNDAARLSQGLHTFLEYGTWMWDHPLFKPMAILAIVLLVFRPYLIAMGMFFCKRVWHYYEGKKMHYRREKEVNSIAADVIYESLSEAVDQGKLTPAEKWLLIERFGNIVPLRDLLPKNDQKTIFEKIKDRLCKTKTPATVKEHRERLTMFMQGNSAEVAK
jgi:hypothetical protein